MHCLIIEDHPVTLFGIEVLIKKKYPTWKITTAGTFRAAMEIIARHSEPAINLCLIDLMLPDGNGLTIIRYLRQFKATAFAKCIAMSVNCDEQIAIQCSDAGAIASVSKANSIADLMKAISLAVSPLREELSSTAPNAHNRPGGAPIRLTARQKDIAKLVMEGYSNKRIANVLNLSYGTVKNYMLDLMRLLGVRSRLELAIRCQEYPHLVIKEAELLSSNKIEEPPRATIDAFNFMSPLSPSDNESPAPKRRTSAGFT